MNQEEFDKEFSEIKERLSIIMELLQEIEEDQRWSWNVKKKFNWPIMKLFARKLRQILKHRLSAWMKE
jgi:hypothetical protein